MDWGGGWPKCAWGTAVAAISYMEGSEWCKEREGESHRPQHGPVILQLNVDTIINT
jgi:hypothetical protein